MSDLTVRDLINHSKERLNLKLICGESGLDRKICFSSAQIFDGNALSFWDNLQTGATLIISARGVALISQLIQDELEQIFKKIHLSEIPFILFSKNEEVPTLFLKLSKKNALPLCASRYDAYHIKNEVVRLLREKIDFTETMSGSLLEVSGVGILITGVSGIGKSECGLELLMRGHKLVADDIVEIHKRDGILYGRSIEPIKHFMEVKGLGIINIETLFGYDSVTDETELNLILELGKWENTFSQQSIDSEELSANIMGIPLYLFKVPVRKTGGMATIVEIMAKNYTLKNQNYIASRDLNQKVFDKIKRGGN